MKIQKRQQRYGKQAGIGTSAPRSLFQQSEPIYRLMIGELLLDESISHRERDEYLSLLLSIERLATKVDTAIIQIARLIHEVSFRCYCDCRNMLMPSWCYLALLLDIQTENWLRENKMDEFANSLYMSNSYIDSG